MGEERPGGRGEAWGKERGPRGRGKPCREGFCLFPLRAFSLSLTVPSQQQLGVCTTFIPLDGPFTPSVMSLGFEVHIFSRLS